LAATITQQPAQQPEIKPAGTEPAFQVIEPHHRLTQLDTAV
jgi:hypothetical protein